MDQLVSGVFGNFNRFLNLRIGLLCVITVDVLYFILWFAIIRSFIVDTTIFVGVVCGIAWCIGLICILRDTPNVLVSYLGIALASTLLLVGAFLYGLFIWLTDDSISGISLLWHLLFYIPAIGCNLAEIGIAYTWWKRSKDYEEIGEKGEPMSSLPTSNRRYS